MISVKPAGGAGGTAWNLYKLAGTEWVLIKADLGVGAGRLEIFGDTMFYSNNVGLYRSIDFGANFTMVLADGRAVAIGSDGTVWATTVDLTETDKSKIWKSTEDGAPGTWSLSHTIIKAPLVGYQVRLNSIDVNPNNPLYIAACGSRISGTVGGRQCVVSTDGGAHWTEYDDFVSNFAGKDDNMHILWGQSNRLIVTHRIKLQISISDTLGASWDVVYDTPEPVSPGWTRDFIRAGMWLWACEDGSAGLKQLQRSGTNGETWEEVWAPVLRPHKGLAYNGGNEALYLAVNYPGDIADADRIKPSAGSDPASTRIHLQYDWATAMGGDGVGVIAYQGIAVYLGT